MIRQQKHSRQSGFTLVETMLVTVVFSMMIAFLGWLTIDSARLANETTTDATMSSTGRVRLDTFINDVRDSSNVLSSWTDPSTTTTYTSHLTTDTSPTPAYYATLVLECPSVGSNNTIVTIQQADGTLKPAYFDHIIYHIQPSGSSNTLNRIVVTDTHSARIASGDTVLAKNVSSGSFTCLVDQAFDGIGTQTVFSLKAPVNTVGGTIVSSASVDGTTQTQPSPMQFVAPTVAYPNGTIQFNTAPASGSHIDALYSVDCSAGNQGLITGVSFDLMLSVLDPSLPLAAQKQTLELSGRANLHNHQ